ncbi:hypothetical protein [Enterocloster bolteae]|uniref:hypothetical protein n=1 Tax=Enterocloster bolteae TaxID=208479 RepID=UPI002A820107|nr:hypothetical protein [Enterocloster bolteae]
MGTKKKNNGSIHEGRSIEIGGLMQQDSQGDIEFIRRRVTNAPDGGIDSEKIIDDRLDYKKYIEELKRR